MVIRLVSVIFLALVGVAVLFAMRSRGAAVRANTTRVPVIVELFTSEGCSSCPPADELLARLDREQSIPGADVIVLGEHVDYWDRLGWKDRFSSAAFTERQTAYAQHLELDSAYTPQAVVNGRTELIASDAEKLRRAVVDNARPAQVEIDLSESGDSIRVRAHSASASADTHVFLATTQSGATTQVKSGENGGRTVHHAPVVLQFSELGPLARSFDREVAIDPGLRGLTGLRAVAIAQDARTLAILGASQLKLQRTAGKLNAGR